MDKIGSMLKQKRLEKGMTIEEISQKTRLTIKHIKAIEEGDISYFKDDLSYLRFFLRAYCDALEINFEPLREALQDSIENYTTSFSTETLLEHAQIEMGVQKTNEKMRQPQTAKKTKRKKKRKYRRVDFSLLSFLAIVVVILIGLIFAFVMWFQGNQNQGQDIAANKPPVKEPTTIYTKDPEIPTPPPVVADPVEEEKEMAITKTSEDSSQVTYQIENLKAEDEMDIEIAFGSNSSFRVLVNDAELSDPPRGIKPYKTVLHVREKAVAEKKIVLAFGFMQNNSVKVNGQTVEIPAALVNKQGSAIVTFIVKGAE